MRAEPYSDADDITIEKKRFISDLKEILKQNQSLSDLLETEDIPNETISTKMSDIRGQSIPQRLEIYKERRIDDQVKWYAKKANYNKTRSRRWFTVSLVFHAAAIVMLLFKIKNPVAKLPVEVIATATGGVLTWIQAKKHNELNASYSHTAHEIMLIKAEAISIVSEDDFSMYVLNTENAFSREHTQWIARKSD